MSRPMSGDELREIEARAELVRTGSGSYDPRTVRDVLWLLTELRAARGRIAELEMQLDNRYHEEPG